jgi:hypothetical protein
LKKVFQTFQKTLPETALRFQKSKDKVKTLENFFEKKFSKPFKKLYLKPLRGSRKAKTRAKPWKTFLEKSFPNLSKNFT